jgi:uroporphyrinogen-III synthase
MSNQQLSGMAVLVTRPAHQADPFCAMVEDAGGRAIRFPVIEIKALPLDQQAINALQQPADGLIFISANAVRLAIDEIRKWSVERLRDSRIMAIGKATARELEHMGVQPDLVPPSPYNSEALLGIPEMQDVSGRRFTIIKGKGGRTYLMEQLRARGAAAVNEIDIYVRVKPLQSNQVLHELSNCPRVVVSITSVKGLHYLFEMASREQADWLKLNAQFLVPGERVADAVRDLHIGHAPFIAENATDAVMFEKLLQSI